MGRNELKIARDLRVWSSFGSHRNPEPISVSLDSANEFRSSIDFEYSKIEVCKGHKEGRFWSRELATLNFHSRRGIFHSP